MAIINTFLTPQTNNPAKVYLDCCKNSSPNFIRKKYGKKHKQRIKQALILFWFQFRKSKTMKQRLSLLVIFAHKYYEPVIGYSLQREKFSKSKKWDANGKRCAMCNRPAVLRHHIILLSHGGLNIGQNIATLCEMCHCEIHPWMESKLSAEINSQTEEHLRSIGRECHATTHPWLESQNPKNHAK